MRDAEVLVVDLDLGVVSARWSPAPHLTTDEDGVREFTPRVLRRMVRSEDGRVFAMVQLHDTSEVDVDVDPDPDDSGADSDPYGGGENGMPPPACDGIVRTEITEVDADSGFGASMVYDIRDGYPLDLTVAADGSMRVATANGVAQELKNAPIPTEPTCVLPADLHRVRGLTTGITTAHDGQSWAVTREPFAVGPVAVLSSGIEGDRTGFAVFADSSGGIACVSCHPDGGDDGHTWNFSTGARRTQSLGGLAVGDTAPFHWNGEMVSMSHLFATVGEDRMGLAPLAGTEEQNLVDLLNALPAPPNDRPQDSTLVAQGRALFEDPTVRCVDCHSGWRYSNGGDADVGTGGRFQVPSLIGVGVRLPLMHDGCADTLRERFDDVACGGRNHGQTAQLTSEEIDALVAFLDSL
jgi:mono/diheme cytochrome c family protein